MKIELPDDHPIAQVIRDVTAQGWPGQLMLSLDHCSRDGIKRIFALEIDSWSTVQTPTRFEIDLTDHTQRVRELEAMTTWPSPPGDSA